MVRATRRDRGAAAVEFALVLPVLLLIIFAIVDFGRMLNAKITINEAAREGARAAALVGTAEANARITMVTAGMGGVSSSVSGCPSEPDPNANATVTVTYSFEFVTPLGILAGLGDPTLEATGVMPCLQ
jgi:Flp pilus assembly protein TadG